MPPKSKVEKSPHHEEIHELLLQGESGRTISKILKEKYNEDIGYGSINTYRRNHIKMEDMVNRRVNEKLAAETEKAVEKEVDTQVAISKKTDYVVEVHADNMIGVMKVAAELVPEYQKAKEEAEDPEIKNVTHKDTSRIALDANKIVNDYNKTQETNVEVNIENNMDSLSNLFNVDRIKSRLNEKRNRKSQ